MKTIMRKFAGRGLGSLLRNAGWAKLGWLCLAGWMINVAQAQPVNNNFASALVITNATGVTNGSNVGATLEPCEISFIMGDDFADIDNSVWFAWTAPSNGMAEFDTAGSDFDTVLAVFTTTNGLCATNLSYVAENDDVTNGVQTSQVNFFVFAGNTYYISVNGNADTGFPFDSGNYELNWSLQPSPANDSVHQRLCHRRLLRHHQRQQRRRHPGALRTHRHHRRRLCRHHQFRLVRLDRAGQRDGGI